MVMTSPAAQGRLHLAVRRHDDFQLLAQHPDFHSGVGIDDDGTIGQGMGANRRDGKDLRGGTDNRPAGGKRIGRGTGRRTDDQPVAAIIGQRFAVDADLQFNHPRNSAVAYDDFVERGGSDAFALARPEAASSGRRSM